MRIRIRRGWRVCAAALATAPLLLQSRAATAQAKFDGFVLDRFEPSVPVDAFFGVPSPAIGGHLQPRASITFDYAHRPFVYDKTATSSIPIVAAQGYLRVAGSLALWDRLLVSVDVPAALANSGQDPGVTGVDFHPPSGPAFGDLRLGLRGRIWGDFRRPFQIGVGSYLHLPTGSKDAYAGEGKVRGDVHVLLGGRAGRGVGLVWSASGGIKLRASESPLATFGAGAGVVFGEDRVQIGPELYGTAQLGGSARTVAAPDYEPKMNVTPNAVALKDD